MLNHMTDRTFMQTYDEIASENNIDKPIRHIVKYLNEIDGIETFCSCGGHKKPDEYQMGKNRFSIEFVAKPKTAAMLVERIYKKFHDDYMIGFMDTTIEMVYVPEVCNEVFYSLKGNISDYDWMW